jgi:hypothetical protein
LLEGEAAAMPGVETAAAVSRTAAPRANHRPRRRMPGADPADLADALPEGTNAMKRDLLSYSDDFSGTGLRCRA